MSRRRLKRSELRRRYGARRLDGKLFLRPTAVGWYIERDGPKRTVIEAGPFTREGARGWLYARGLSATVRRGLGRYL